MKTSRTVLVALTAALAFSLAVGAASANRLAGSNQNFRITWGALTFEGGLGVPAVCPVTLEGTFHSRTLSKTPEGLVGYVNRGVIGSCQAGNVSILTASFPWHVRYATFEGALPEIRKVKATLRNVAFLMRRTTILGSVECLYSGIMSGWFNRNTVGGGISTLTPEGTIGNPVRLGGTLNCPATGELLGNGEVFVQGSTTRISVTLVQ